MAVRVLLVLAVLMSFYGCGQSSPAPEQGEKEEVEETVEEKPEATPKPETTAATETTEMATTQASASANPATAPGTPDASGPTTLLSVSLPFSSTYMLRVAASGAISR